MKTFKGIFILLVFGFASSACAATLSFSPASGQHTVGQTLAVAILLSSTNQAANAMAVAISFPADKLSVVSISKTGSVVQLWASEPTYSNTQGIITFEGVIPNPGFQGAGARLVTIYFKLKNLGKVPVIFDTSSVLANDGLGTNILINVNNAEFSLVSAIEKPQEESSSKPEQLLEESSASTTIIESVEPSPVPGPVTSYTEEPFWYQWYLFLALFIFILLLFLFFAWYVIRKPKREIHGKTISVDSEVHRAFQLLREDLKSHVEDLLQARSIRNLTPEEEKFIEYVKHNLSDTEKYLTQSIKAQSIKNKNK